MLTRLVAAAPMSVDEMSPTLATRNQEDGQERFSSSYYRSSLVGVYLLTI